MGLGVPSSGLGESSTYGVQTRRPGALAREEEEVRVRRPMPTYGHREPAVGTGSQVTHSSALQP